MAALVERHPSETDVHVLGGEMSEHQSDAEDDAFKNAGRRPKSIQRLTRFRAVSLFVGGLMSLGVLLSFTHLLLLLLFGVEGIAMLIVSVALDRAIVRRGGTTFFAGQHH